MNRFLSMAIVIVALTAMMVMVTIGCGNEKKVNESAKSINAATTAVVAATDTVPISSDDTSVSGAENDDDAHASVPSYQWHFDPSGRIKAVYEPNVYYDVEERSNISDADEIIGLYHESGEYYLKPITITFKVEEHPEAGDMLVLSADTNVMLLFVNFSGYNKDKISTASLPQVVSSHDGRVSIWGQELLPNKKMVFGFGGKQYMFEASGEIVDRGDYNYWVENYTLTFGEDGASNKQPIVKHEELHATNIKILFIGDLDGDGKPDVILDANPYYVTSDVQVFLSSTAKDGEYLRLEAANVRPGLC